MTEKKLLQSKLRKASVTEKSPGVSRSAEKKNVATSTEDLGNDSSLGIDVMLFKMLLHSGCCKLCLHLNKGGGGFVFQNGSYLLEMMIELFWWFSL
jgi:hypothetical protein